MSVYSSAEINPITSIPCFIVLLKILSLVFRTLWSGVAHMCLPPFLGLLMVSGG